MEKSDYRIKVINWCSIAMFCLLHLQKEISVESI